MQTIHISKSVAGAHIPKCFMYAHTQPRVCHINVGLFQWDVHSGYCKSQSEHTWVTDPTNPDESSSCPVLSPADESWDPSPSASSCTDVSCLSEKNSPQWAMVLSCTEDKTEGRGKRQTKRGRTGWRMGERKRDGEGEWEEGRGAGLFLCFLLLLFFFFCGGERAEKVHLPNRNHYTMNLL